jgi:hypothetical protein
VRNHENEPTKSGTRTRGKQASDSSKASELIEQWELDFRPPVLKILGRIGALKYLLPFAKCRRSGQIVSSDVGSISFCK